MNLPRLEDGTLQSYAWPGGYPLYYLDKGNNVLCPDCAIESEKAYMLDILGDIAAWCLEPEYDYFGISLEDELPVVADINYEGDLYCDACSQQIKAAYPVENEPQT